MAIIKSLAIGKSKGSMGGLTYRYVSGETIGSAKVAFPKVPRTMRQMTRRIGWGNMVNFWQALENIWHPSFERAAGRVSDFNLFIGVNQNRAPYLTKEEISKGGCVVAPYTLTEGTLESIEMSVTENGIITSNLNVGSLALDDETTLAAFSAAIRANNVGWNYGDQLSAVIFVQTVDVVTNIPKVVARAYEITLAEDDETFVLDLIGNNPECFSIASGKLCFSAAVNGGGVYVHSRLAPDGTTQVSTQAVEVTNTLLSTYSTETKAIASIQSYGGKTTTPFLTPDVINFNTI